MIPNRLIVFGFDFCETLIRTSGKGDMIIEIMQAK